MTKGFYNLPVEEQDKYNVKMTHEELIQFYQKTVQQKIKRDNKVTAPTDGENFTSYLKRLQVMLTALDEQAVQEHMYGVKGPWYVHKRPSNCFICDYSTMVNQMLNILHDLAKIKSISSLSFGMKEGSHVRLSNSKAVKARL